MTGASSGVGREIALCLARISSSAVAIKSAPVNIIISSRSVSALEAVAHQCRALCPASKVCVLQLDLANSVQSENIWPALERYGVHRVHHLINNAGVSSRGVALSTTTSTLQHVFNVNFFGPVALTRVVASRMIEQGVRGSITYVSSVQGRVAIPYRSPYTSSKHAAQGFFDCLRAEVAGAGIDVTIVSPGYINTPISVNALRGDGTGYGIMDQTQSTGMAASFAAQSTLLAIARRRPDVVLADAKSRVAIQGKAQFPDLIAYIMRKRPA